MAKYSQKNIINKLKLNKMGYRSKVIIGVKSGELSKEFDKILSKHGFNDGNDTEYLRIHEDPNDKTFYTFNYIKWYESDDWCKEIVDFLEKVSEDNDNAFCIGLGEDGVVHSEIGVYWDYVEQFSEINLID
jgi:hypothetical protein